MKEDRRQKKSGSKALLTVLLVIFAGIFIFALTKLIPIVTEYERGKDIYDDVRESFTIPANEHTVIERTTRSTEEATEPAEPEPDDGIVRHIWPDQSGYEHEKQLRFLHTTFDYILVPMYALDMSALQQINSDVRGWIQIDGTHVDYPIVQGENNEKYLRAAITGEANNAGSIFIDYRIDTPFNTKNTIIYGHNQRNSQMFHDLLLYENEGYYKDHPYIKVFTTDGEILLYRVFSAYYMTNTYTYKYKFPSDEVYQKYIDYMMGESIWFMGTKPTVDREVLTLSTCTNQFDDRRFVVHGVLVSRQKRKDAEKT